MAETMKTFWRRFAGSVIGLKDKYWEDPFFRTELNTVILQIAFGSVLVLIVGIYFNYLERDILKAVFTSLVENIENGVPIEAEDIIETTETVKSEYFLIFLSVASLLTLSFSLLVAKITLAPTRNALKSQKRFISDVAHELRTPLSIIKANSEVALLEENIDPELSKVIRSNIDELDRISEIINNLLSLSKIIRPQDLHFRNVDMGLIIDNAVSKLKDLANGKNIQISIKKVTPHVVWGNTGALEQITVNLLKNALNYTPSSKQVWIEVQPDYQGNIILTFRDSGLGIKKEDLSHVFEPFYKADRSRSREFGSSGLGLTIVSELVKLHNGRITIKSAVGAGTTVIILLPYGKVFSSSGNKENGASEVSMDFLKR